MRFAQTNKDVRVAAIIPQKPQAPAQIRLVQPRDLSNEQVQQAFARIQQGEKLHQIARDFGQSMGQLRGI